MRAILTIYAPVGKFLPKILEGWNLPDPVEPMMGHHGRYSILMWRYDDGPAGEVGEALSPQDEGNSD